MLRFRLLTASLSCLAFTASAEAQASERAVFAQSAVSDGDLAACYGGFGNGDAGTRTVTDAAALLTLQQVGSTSSIAMDNWWSQTGAALIADNLLARPEN